MTPNFQQYSTYDSLRPWTVYDAGLHSFLAYSFLLNLFE